MSGNHFAPVWRKRGIRGGAPCIRGTGIGVAIVAERFAAGDYIGELARDYNLQPAQIEAAIRLVVAGAFGPRGVPVRIERRMEELIPLE